VGKWQVGQCGWTFLKTSPLSKMEFTIDTVDNFSDFSFTYKTVHKDYEMNVINSNRLFETEQVVACT